jgi:hypothetical protein
MVHTQNIRLRRNYLLKVLFSFASLNEYHWNCHVSYHVVWMTISEGQSRNTQDMRKPRHKDAILRSRKYGTKTWFIFWTFGSIYIYNYLDMLLVTMTVAELFSSIDIVHTDQYTIRHVRSVISHLRHMIRYYTTQDINIYIYIFIYLFNCNWVDTRWQ